MNDDPSDANGPGQAADSADVVYSIDDEESPSEAVVLAVSALTDTPVVDLDPLYDVTDPDHLDGLFESAEGEGFLESGSVSFTFNGCTVVLTQDAVRVSERTDDAG